MARVKWTSRALRAVIGGAVAATMLGGSFAAPVAAARRPLVLGVVSIATTDWLNHAVILGIQRVARQHGWTVDVVNANGSADAANSAIEDFVQKKVSGIFDLVFPATSIRAGLQAAIRAHIPVLTWGGGLAPGVAASNGGGGPFAVPAVSAMVKDLHGKGAVLALTYHVGLVCQQREQVMDRILAKHPGIQVTKEEVQIPGDFQSGYQYATSWLAAHPAGSGHLAIWGCWEDPALGAISALKAEHRHDVLVFGENGSPAALQAIKSGWLTATTWENGVAEGSQLAKLLPVILKAGTHWRPRTFNVPGVLVTRRNVVGFLRTHPGGYLK